MIDVKKLTLAGAALVMLGNPVSVKAQQQTSNHSMGSGNDVWRIELRNLENFLAMSVGDSDGVGELRSIKIGLSGPEGQNHFKTEMNPFLQVNGGARTTNNSINVRMGDVVSLDRLDPARGINDTYNMWIHAKERSQTGFGITTLNFEITVEARELDCFRDRVCRRGSTGTVTYFVTLPVPTGTANRCKPDNSYRISAAATGAQMTLTPMSRAGGREPVNARVENSGGHTISLRARGLASRMELAMQGGEVCIAWTGRRP